MKLLFLVMRKINATIGIYYNNMPITERQIRILKLIAEKKSQNKVAELLNIPPSAVNIQIKRLEKKIGEKLILSSTYGTILSETGQEIIKYYELKKKRMSSDKFVCCGYLSGEIGKLLFDNVVISSFDNIIKMYNMDLLSVIGIDDPYWSIDFKISPIEKKFYNYETENYRCKIPIPIVYDYFIMAHNKDYEFNNENLIGIRYSPQRLVWNILKNENIKFKITKTVKNPFEAIELLNEGYSIYINKSFKKYINNNCIIEKPYFYDKTKHTINFIQLFNENNNLESIENLVFKNKNKILKRGFELVDYFY